MVSRKLSALTNVTSLTDDSELYVVTPTDSAVSWSVMQSLIAASLGARLLPAAVPGTDGSKVPQLNAAGDAVTWESLNALRIAGLADTLSGGVYFENGALRFAAVTAMGAGSEDGDYLGLAGGVVRWLEHPEHIHHGPDVPANDLGEPDDYFIRTSTTPELYRKNSPNTWVLIFTWPSGSGGGLDAAQVNALIETKQLEIGLILTAGSDTVQLVTDGTGSQMARAYRGFDMYIGANGPPTNATGVVGDWGLGVGATNSDLNDGDWYQKTGAAVWTKRYDSPSKMTNGEIDAGSSETARLIAATGLKRAVLAFAPSSGGQTAQEVLNAIGAYTPAPSWLADSPSFWNQLQVNGSGDLAWFGPEGAQVLGATLNGVWYIEDGVQKRLDPPAADDMALEWDTSTGRPVWSAHPFTPALATKLASIATGAQVNLGGDAIVAVINANLGSSDWQGGGGGGITATAVNALIATHTGVSTAHHTPPTGGTFDIAALGVKGIPALPDQFALVDSEASNVLKKTTMTGILAAVEANANRLLPTHVAADVGKIAAATAVANQYELIDIPDGGDPYAGATEATALGNAYRFLLSDPSTNPATKLYMDAIDVGNTFRLEHGPWDFDTEYRLGDIVETTDSDGDVLFWIASEDIGAHGIEPSLGRHGKWWLLASHGAFRGNLSESDSYALWHGDTYRVGDRFFAVKEDVVSVTGDALTTSDNIIELTGGGGGGSTKALNIQDVGAADINMDLPDRIYDSTIDMPATADIADSDEFRFSFQYRAGQPPLKSVSVSGKDWKTMVALTATQQSQASFSPASANKVLTFFLRRTTASGGQSQQNVFIAKGTDGASLYVGDNNNPFDANVQVWQVKTVSVGGGGNANVITLGPTEDIPDATEVQYNAGAVLFRGGVEYAVGQLVGPPVGEWTFGTLTDAFLAGYVGVTLNAGTLYTDYPQASQVDGAWAYLRQPRRWATIAGGVWALTNSPNSFLVGITSEDGIRAAHKTVVGEFYFDLSFELVRYIASYDAMGGMTPVIGYHWIAAGGGGASGRYITSLGQYVQDISGTGHLGRSVVYSAAPSPVSVGDPVLDNVVKNLRVVSGELVYDELGDNTEVNLGALGGGGVDTAALNAAILAHRNLVSAHHAQPPYSAATPTRSAAAGAVGSATNVSRGDHAHQGPELSNVGGIAGDLVGAWLGTQAELDAISNKDSNSVYFVR